MLMSEVFEIHGCIEVPVELSKEEFVALFIELIESKNWAFGGSIAEFLNESQVDSDDTKEKRIIE